VLLLLLVMLMLFLVMLRVQWTLLPTELTISTLDRQWPKDRPVTAKQQQAGQ
jgi:hypothetical protein